MHEIIFPCNISSLITISRYFPPPGPKNTILRFVVKFFPPDHTQLLEELTRYVSRKPRPSEEEHLKLKDVSVSCLAWVFLWAVYGLHLRLSATRRPRCAVLQPQLFSVRDLPLIGLLCRHQTSLSSGDLARGSLCFFLNQAESRCTYQRLPCKITSVTAEDVF